jgi:transcription elongation factor
VTIKTPESKRYAADNPWFVFEGTDPDTIREKILATFGIEADASLSLFDVTMNAQRIASRQGEIQNSLGGTTLNVEKTGSAQPTGSTESASATGADTPAWEDKPAEEPTVNPLFAKVESQTGVAALQRLWAENKAAFDADADLFAAYKSKGKALQDAGAA